MAREFANVELVFRSLLRSPGLGKYAKKINLDNRPWSGGTSVETVPLLFACVPDGYLNKSDLKLAYEFISAISTLPILGEFPAGRYAKAHHNRVEDGQESAQLGWAGLPHSESLNAQTPIHSFRRHLFTQFREGRQDALVGAMLYFFSNLVSVANSQPIKVLSFLTD